VPREPPVPVDSTVVADLPTDRSLQGTLQHIVYRNDDSGFTIGRLDRDDRSIPTTIKGTLPGVGTGERIQVLGRWIEDPRYGPQFLVESFLPLSPDTADALERHLGGSLMDGIGPVFARRLVEHFGPDLIDVLDNHPERLRGVPGIGPTRAARIVDSWREQRGRRDALLFLQGLGLSASLAVRVHKMLGHHTVEAIREDPWKLTEVRGIGFPTADGLAKELGVAPEHPRRLAAALRYLLDEAAMDGDCYLDRSVLVERVASLLSVPAALIPVAISAAVGARDLVDEGARVWTFESWDDEDAAAGRLRVLRDATPKEVDLDVPGLLLWAQERSGLQLTPTQREAIGLALVNKVVVITGGPGTGKTTIVRALLDGWERMGLQVRLAAPTGRAARRMEEATGRRASTLHRLLDFQPAQQTFGRNLQSPLQGDALVVDEASMIDAQMIRCLLDGLPDPMRLVLVGDVDQLPSVGPGRVLADIIDSAVVPTIRLDVVFRQAEQSDIVRAAHGVLKGLVPRGATSPDGDFFFISRPDPAAAVRTAVHVVAERIPQRWNLDPTRDVQVLSPQRRGGGGIEALNEALREKLNPATGPEPPHRFRAGDRVMQIRNAYDKDVFNGDVGFVEGPGFGGKGVRVAFEGGRTVDYEAGELDMLTQAWAVTIHKSQGSEYPAVVVLLLDGHHRMLQRNLLYTAMTRGRRVVVVVGSPRALENAVTRTGDGRRNTRLAERLRGEL